MAINLASKASDKVVERFNLASCTEGLFADKYDWTGVATVNVYSVDTLQLQNYDRTAVNGSRFGALTELGDRVQTMTVTDDKSFNGAIDKGNNTSQLMMKSAGRVIRRQTDEVIIPYVDTYRLSHMAAGAGLVHSVTTAPTTSTVIEAIMTAGAKMSNQKVPKAGRVIYIGETLAIAVKLSSQIIGLDTLAEKSIVNGVCGQIDGSQVRVVPDSYMPAGVQFMIVHKGCAVAPKKLETFRILEQHPDIDGAVVQGRLLQDCFVLDARADGILICVADTAAHGGGYTYQRLINPSGNPYASGWYTKYGTTFTPCPSAETIVNPSKPYYKRLA